MWNLLELKKEVHNTTIKDIRQFFKLKNGNEAITDRVIRDIRNLLSMKKKKIIINQ